MNRPSTEAPLLFPDISLTRARLTPNRTAVIDLSWGSREEYSFAETDAAAICAASEMKRLGIGKGDRVAVLAYNHVEYIYLYMATAKLGFILAPLNWRLTPSDIAFMIDDVEPKLVYVEEEFEDLLSDALRESSHRPREILSLESLRGAHRGECELPGRPTIDLESPQMLLYTGGTTGRPKAAMIPYRQALWNAFNTIISWGLREDDRAPIFFPFFHTGGWHVLTVPLYLAGGSVILVKRFDAVEAIQVIESERATIVIGVPTMFYDMARAPNFSEAKFESVRFFKSGGGMSPLSLMEKYWAKGKPYYQGYGLTEAGPNLFTTTPEGMMTKALSVGKPSLFTEVKIVTEDGREAGPGEEGELWVRGPVVFAGYWRRPDETRATITEEGWVKTGDIFRVDEDGYYYFVSRKKFMIKTGGENVYPDEVEEAIRSHPDVDETAVFGVPDPKWGEAVAAVVKPRTPTLTSDELKKYLRERLARYKVPKYIWIVEEIPRTAVGKIDYMRLRREYSLRLGGSNAA